MSLRASWKNQLGSLVIGGLCTVATALANDVVVTTPQGELIGTTVTVGDTTVNVFKGIPYGVPPVGVRRWQPTQPAPGWQGKRLAKAFGPACVQPQGGGGEGSFYYSPLPQMSEDCLYLNVFTPARSEVEKSTQLPVMVWIHGGSLIDGASNTYDGKNLASRGVVIVTINYRLNVFGYLSHPELNAESPRGVSGNYGTLDQIQALKWVRDNIAAYGGDPANVTIFGESAGALSVSHLMATPLSKGLFHRAIMQSAYLPPMLAMQQPRYGKAAAESTGQKLAQAAGVKTLAQLRELTAMEIFKASQKIGFYPDPVIDGWVFHEEIATTFEQGRQHNVPLMVGFNSGETTPFADIPGLLAPVPDTPSAYVAAVKARYGDLADDYLALYPPDDLQEARLGPTRDGFYGWAAQRFATNMATVKANAYLYYFDHIPPEAAAMGVDAFHAAEIPYVFGTLGETLLANWPALPATPANQAMADTMMGYWVAFAERGAPLAPDIPKWQPYRDDARHYMAFRNGRAEPGKNLKPGVFELHETVISQRRKSGVASWWLQDLGIGAPVIEAE